MKAKSVSICITPKSRVPLGAASDGKTVWLSVTEEIEANLLALWLVNDAMPVLVISVDLLYPGRILRDAVEAAAVGIAADHIFLAASHTHQAPMTDDTKPRFGTVDADYMRWLRDKISQAVEFVLRPESAQAVTLTIAQSQASHSINRRRFARFFLAKKPIVNSMVMAPNRHGTTDESIITASIRTADDQPIALLWNYACHPVGFPLRNTVAAHYPHVIRETARSRFHDPVLPVLFFQGFSGNTRPRESAKVHTPLRRLRRLMSGPLFEDMTAQGYADWSTSLAKEVMHSIANERRVESNYISTSRVLRASKDFAEPLEEDVSFHGLSIGPRLSILGVSGEVVAEYAPKVRGMTKSEFTFCVGCIDHPFGYIPTSKIIAEGGYEGGEYREKFDLSYVNPSIEEHCLAGFRSVIACLDSQSKSTVSIPTSPVSADERARGSKEI